MSFRGKLLIALVVMISIPVFLITLSFMIILSVKFNLNDSNLRLKKSFLAPIENNIRFLTREVQDSYNELKYCKEKTPDKLKDLEYLNQVADRLKERYTYLYVLYQEELFYSSNDSFYMEIEEILKTYELYQPNHSGYYQDEKVQIMLKVLPYEDGQGRQMRIYLVSNIFLMDEESGKAIGVLFLSLLLSIAISGTLLVVWINRVLINPINSLKSSTREIIEGNLNTIIRKDKKDKISELCNDFDDMRKHIKQLREKNLNNERNMREIMVHISHDLRTPLTSIKGYAMGLLEGVAKTPEKEKKYLDTICNKTNEMNTLIEELSTFAKLDMNFIPYQFKKVKIDDYIKAGIKNELTDFEVERFSVSYERKIEEDTLVLMDPEQIKKVMNNVIFNAKKYRNPDKKGILKISTHDEGGFIRIDVEDNGKGIKKENLTRVFDQFFREDDSRNSKIGGSGLGLAIVKKIVQNHGGEVWIASEEGKWTKVSILLKKVSND